MVSGAGDIKLTKDGHVLLMDMQIQHPTAALIARTATAQDDITGDGTTSNVLFTGELLKQCERYLTEGLHPRVLVEGIELGRERALEFLDSFRYEAKSPSRDQLAQVARTSLRTKVHAELADLLTDITTDAVLCVRKGEEPIDLHMIEMMHMEHKTDLDTRLIKGTRESAALAPVTVCLCLCLDVFSSVGGSWSNVCVCRAMALLPPSTGLVLDHGARHPDMPKRSEDCFILTLNVSLEYEKTEVNSGIFYKDAADREKMVAAERKHTDDKVDKYVLCEAAWGPRHVVADV